MKFDVKCPNGHAGDLIRNFEGEGEIRCRHCHHEKRAVDTWHVVAQGDSLLMLPLRLVPGVTSGSSNVPVLTGTVKVC